MLTDSFGRIHDYLRIALTETCNLGCTYCMPMQKIAHTRSAKLMKADEIASIAGEFVHMGVKKIRLTGGEPLLRVDFEDVLRKLSRLPASLALTTNGVYLNKYLDQLIHSNATSLNISLDTLQKTRFRAITGVDAFEDVLSNIIACVHKDLFVKVNIVTIRGTNDDELLDFVELTRNLPLHIRFIEYMPFNGNQWEQEKVIGHAEIVERISLVYNVQKLVDLKHDTAKKYQIKGFEGTFSVISTISEPFCDNCNRLRLTADGKMKNCLFSSEETDLLTALRNGKDMKPLIQNSLANKHWQQGGQEMSNAMQNRSMILIGG